MTALWCGVFLLLFNLSCGSASERQTDALKQDDPAGFTAMSRMQEKISRGQNLSPEEFALAKRLHEKYPAVAPLRQVMVSSLQMRRDWGGMAALIVEIPPQERSRDDQLLLSQAYLNSGRYREAEAIAGPLADAAPADVELNGAAGQAWFNTGDHVRAAAAFDRVWPGLVTAKSIDAVVDRGLIYFYLGDPAKAIVTLNLALGMNPESISANSALARVYSAAGDQTKAADHQQRAEQAHARATADEARAMRLVGLSHDLQSAWNEKRYGDCVQVAQQMIPLAPPAVQISAYQFLAQCLQAQGKTAEAQNAQNEAARLGQLR